MLQRDHRGGKTSQYQQRPSRKSLACQFCKQDYSRRDTLQKHSIICPKRGQNPLPDFRRSRGRARPTCDLGASQKVSCDGASPCSACDSRGLSCVRSHDGTEALASLDLGDADMQVGNQRSLSLLRDDQEEVFASRFNVPRPFRSLDRASTVEVYDSPAGTASDVSGFDFEFIDMLFNPSLFTADVWYADESPISQLHACLGSDNDKSLHTNGDEEPRLNNIVKSIMCVPSVERLAPKEKERISAKLRHLFTPGRVANFIRYFFDCWHRNCRVIHRPTFVMWQVEDYLLVTMVLLGAMYSPNQGERALASSIMYHAEKYVFFHIPARSGQEIGGSAKNNGISCFQAVQAGLLMIMVQFWTGDMSCKQRVMTIRFDQIIDVTRSMGVLRARHELEDRVSEASWLRKECIIRVATYLILLDCAFLFFKGIPLRVVSAEIECDLPCEEAIFDAAHPFAMEEFSFRRRISSASAFQSLFAIDEPLRPLVMLDTFITMHMLYRYVNDVLTLALCRREVDSFEGLLSDVEGALDKWHQGWRLLKADAIVKHTWEDMGFWRHGDQYEAAIRLLLSDPARPYWSRLLRSNVDRLELLKRLTVNESLET